MLTIIIFYVGFDVLTVVTMKSTIIWDVMPCHCAACHIQENGTLLFWTMSSSEFIRTSMFHKLVLFLSSGEQETEDNLLCWAPCTATHKPYSDHGLKVALMSGLTE
jgi:hypothetical protein